MIDSTWIGSDFQEPPRTDGGVALCGACRRTGLCRLGLTQERLEFLSEASRILSGSLDYNRTLRHVAQLVVDAVMRTR